MFGAIKGLFSSRNDDLWDDIDVEALTEEKRESYLLHPPPEPVTDLLSMRDIPLFENLIVVGVDRVFTPMRSRSKSLFGSNSGSFRDSCEGVSEAEGEGDTETSNKRAMSRVFSGFGEDMVRREGGLMGVFQPSFIRASPKILYMESFNEDGVVPGNEIAMFCFPEGVKIDSIHSRRAKYSNLFMESPQTFEKPESSHAFVLTTADGSRLYCAAVWAMFRVDAALSFQTHDGEHGRNSSSSGEKAEHDENKYLVAPRCFCLVSRLPFISMMMEIIEGIIAAEVRLSWSKEKNAKLELLRSTFVDGNGNGNQNQDIDREKEKSQIIDTLSTIAHRPTPKPGEMLRFGGSTSATPHEVLTDMITFNVPTHDSVAHCLAAYSLKKCFCALSVDTILDLMSLVLLEQSVVITTPNIELLSMISLAVVPLIRPFKLVAVYIPVLPVKLVTYLQAPTPYCIGVSAVPAALAQLPGISYLDVETGHVRTVCEDSGSSQPRTRRLTLFRRSRRKVNATSASASASGNASLPRLPGRYELSQKLEELSKPLRESPLTPPWEQKIVSDICNAVRTHLDKMVSTIYSYTVTDTSDAHNPIPVFLPEAYLADIDYDDRPFMKRFMSTMMFDAFCETSLRERKKKRADDLKEKKKDKL